MWVCDRLWLIETIKTKHLLLPKWWSCSKHHIWSVAFTVFLHMEAELTAHAGLVLLFSQTRVLRNLSQMYMNHVSLNHYSKSMRRPHWCYLSASASSCSFFCFLFCLFSAVPSCSHTHHRLKPFLFITFFKKKVTTTKITRPEEK